MPASSTLITVKEGSASARADVVSAHSIAIVDGATPGTIPVYTAEMKGGHLSGVGVKFGTTAPNSLTVTVSDMFGVTIAIGTRTASGRLESFAPQPFVGPLTVAVTGNTTANATGTIVLFAF